MKKLGIVALAAVAALAACKKDSDNTVVNDSTAVVADTTGAMPAPMAAPVTPTDTTMAPIDTTAAGGMTDTTAMDTTKKM
jgi:hypothetical protein